MIWPFKRKSAPINPGPINEDWAYGDLAEMISGGSWIRANGEPSVGPEKGDVSKVLRIAHGESCYGAAWGLELSGFSGLFVADRFRKVPPLNSAADEQFTCEIRALKPNRVQA